MYCHPFLLPFCRVTQDSSQYSPLIKWFPSSDQSSGYFSIPHGLLLCLDSLISWRAFSEELWIFKKAFFKKQVDCVCCITLLHKVVAPAKNFNTFVRWDLPLAEAMLALHWWIVYSKMSTNSVHRYTFSYQVSGLPKYIPQNLLVSQAWRCICQLQCLCTKEVEVVGLLHPVFHWNPRVDAMEPRRYVDFCVCTIASSLVTFTLRRPLLSGFVT